MKAARYLNWRINRQVNAEDTALIARVQQGMASRSFSVGPLSRQGGLPAPLLPRGCATLIPEARQRTARPRAGMEPQPHEPE